MLKRQPWMHRLNDTWLIRNVALLITLAAFISTIVTYTTITGGNAPLGIKPKRVSLLLSIDVGLLGLLSAIIAFRVYALWKNLRAGLAGSRLQKRILILFAVVTALPTLVVSVFSAMLFNFGIQAWFNEQVQTAVDESLAVAEAYLGEHKINIRGDAIAMANDLNQVAALAVTDPPEFTRIVETQATLRVLTEAFVLKRNRILAQGRLSFALAFEHIPQDELERAARGEVIIMTSENDKVRALVKLDALEDTYLLVGRLIDNKVLVHMQHTQGAVNEYNTMKNHLDVLQKNFTLVFVTLTLLMLLSSIWYGMVFASRLTKPITHLVMAAERVRGGDFSARVDDSGQKDEVATLSRTFNRMTEQLEAQRGQLIDANRRLDERRRFSEAVLSGVSAGVIALDRNKNITLFNRSASAIFSEIDEVITPQQPINEVLPNIQELLLQAEHILGEIAQSTITLEKNGKIITLHVRVTAEMLNQEVEGFIVTFDDITLLITAQRNAAWADVARRIAHEIRNPLTPIQLAAERLKRKYLKFITEDQETYVKYVDTITKHVADIGRMVEEFVAFARMPTPRFVEEDVSSIIRKALFSEQIAHPLIEYELSMPEKSVMLMADERQLMQVMINILKNAAESIETRLESEENAGIKGHICVALACENNQVTLTIQDNGTGFATDKIEQVLEPYFTTRSKGTGLGLSIVKKIVEDHKGRINLENNPTGGALVTLSFLQQCDINTAIL